MEKIICIISETLGESVDENSKKSDFPGWDSLKMLQIIMALDEEGYSIPIEKIADISSVRDILDFCK